MISKGEWHIHTSYTDGENTIDEYCKAAIELGIPIIAITEHFRRNPTYDFDKYLKEIWEAKINYPNLIVVSGVEVKILEDGTLDASLRDLLKVEYVIGSIHSFPVDEVTYYNAVWRAVNMPLISTWGHPMKFLKENKFKPDKDIITPILKRMKNNNIWLEKNTKYGVPPKNWLATASKLGVTIVEANDIHSVEELIKKRKG